MKRRRVGLSALLLCVLALAACTLSLPGTKRFSPQEDVMLDHTAELSPATVGAGAGKIVVDVELPPGYKFSELASSAILWQVVGDVVALPGEAGQPVAIDGLPVEMEASFQAGTGELVGDLFLGYCQEGQEGICLLEQARLRVPVTVREEGEPILRVTHRVVLPALGDQ